MSIQNALKLIQKSREDKSINFPTFKSINELVDFCEKENLPCSKEELVKAFQIDWNMRWLKHITKNS